MENNSESSCLNDPNFAIICAFLQRFSTTLNIVYPDFSELQKMIENTDEVAEDLKTFIVKLLRKSQKSIAQGKWELALANFCSTYSAKDASEIRHIGFNKSKLAVKLRAIKEILEYQFERNVKFKTETNLLSANELRSQPIGKDMMGNSYWCTVDHNYNLRIYQEHLDKNVWKICAHDEVEMADLITRLKKTEWTSDGPMIIQIDEDCNSMPQEILDATLANGNIDDDFHNDAQGNIDSPKPGEPEIRENLNVVISDDYDDESSISSQDESEYSAYMVVASTNTPVEDKIPPLVITKSIPNKNLDKTESTNSKLPSKRTVESKSSDELASKVPKFQRPTSLGKNQTIKSNKLAHIEGDEDDGDYDDEAEDEDTSKDEDETGDDEIGEEIVEPFLHVHGVGSGEANEGTYLDLLDLAETEEIGEAIEEDVIFIVGVGSGAENDVGSPENKPTSDKPMFFFGQAGCLKLSPIKQPNPQKVENNAENVVKTNLFIVEDATEVGQSSTDVADAIRRSEVTKFEKTIENDVNVIKATPEIKTISSTGSESSTVEEANASFCFSDMKEVSNTAESIENNFSSDEKNLNAFNIPSKTNVSDSNHNESIQDKDVDVSNTSAADNKLNSRDNDNNSFSQPIVAENRASEQVDEIGNKLVESTSLTNDTNSANAPDSIKASPIFDVASESTESIQPNTITTKVNELETCDTTPKNIDKDSDFLVPESKTDDQTDNKESVVELAKASKSAMWFPIDIKNNPSSNEERKSDTADSVQIPQADIEKRETCIPAVEKSETLENFSNEPMDTVSSDGKVVTDSGSNESEITHRIQVATDISETDAKSCLVQPDQSARTMKPKKAETEQFSEHKSAVEIDHVNSESVLSTAALNFSTTNQSDEIISEPITENATPPDVTLMSIPSVDDQDHLTTSSVPDDPIPTTETAADISVKEIGKFQIFNRKVNEKTTSDCNAEETDCPTKLQYDGSEETKTPLELTHLRVTKVPSTEEKQLSSQFSKESKSTDSTSSSYPIPKSTDDTNPLDSSKKELSPTVRPVISDQHKTKFPISFTNTQINNRKRPLLPMEKSSTKNDLDSDDDESSESSEEEVEVKRQKTKPKLSHLAARKNVEVKRKAAQIDYSSDEDEPVRKVPMKAMIEKAGAENVVKQSENVQSSNKPLQGLINADNSIANADKSIKNDVGQLLSKEESGEKDEKQKVLVTLPVESIVSSENVRKENNTCEVELKSALLESQPNVVEILPTILTKVASDSNNSELQSIGEPENVRKVEDIKQIPRQEIIKSSVAEPVRSRPGPKSKKPIAIVSPKPEPIIEAIDVETIIQKHEVIAKESDSEIKNSLENAPTGTRSRTTRAVTALQAPKTNTPAPSKPTTTVPKPTETSQEITSNATPVAIHKAEPPPKVPLASVAKSAATPPSKSIIQPKSVAKSKPPPKTAPTKKPTPAASKQPSKSVSSDSSTPKKETPKQRKLMGLIVDDNAILSTQDGETPVRQSRRIAQIKIKEEAERRKEEETALKQMKAASDKKKKVDETHSPFDKKKKVDDQSYSESTEENSEQDSAHKKKKKKKVARGANPWQTDSEHDESDVSEEENYESDQKIEFFKSDHEFSPESEIEDESQIVQTKRARTAQKDDDTEVIDDGYACQKCNKHDHPEWILLCDKCDKGYHCSCLIPVLFIIPEGDWFCPPCQQDKLIECLENQLVSLDKELQEREMEELKTQRLKERTALNSVSTTNVLPGDDDEDMSDEKPKPKSVRKRPTTGRRRRRNDISDQSNASSSSSSSGSSRSASKSTSSGSNSSDDEPIYKLRKRRQTNVSYRFNEYDDLINSAIKKEMDNAEGAGNLGRGKDISTIIEADKEEKRIKQMGDDEEEDNKAVPVTEGNVEPSESENPETVVESENPQVKDKKSGSDSDSEPIRTKIAKRPVNKKTRKKNRKLNSLDIESEDDGSDDDFRTSSFSEDEEDENFSGESESDSELDYYRNKKNKKHGTRRSVRSRRKRYDDAFINDSDCDIEEPKTRKRKKKEDSDFSDFNDNDSTDEEAEDVDSDDLCDSTDSNESNGGWRSKKSKKSIPRKPRPPVDNANAGKTVAKKKVKKIEDTAFRAGIPKAKGKNITDESDDENVQTKGRRTRGKKLTYLNLLDEFESSDSDGIKPGVKRPDTPPEERAAFIKKQEEIKRMLAEKNTEAAKALAAPKLNASTPEKARRPGPVDSLSTIPRQIIQNAKALDPDYKKGRDSDDTDGFDDDLPDDFDAEGMDEEEIAKMMEEEDFAQQQLKAVGERVRKMKEAELLSNKKKEAVKIGETTEVTPTALPSSVPPHLATPPSVVVPPTSYSPRPNHPAHPNLSHLIRAPHASPLSPGNLQHIQGHSMHHPSLSPHGPQHLSIHSHLSPHGPHLSHHLPPHNPSHPPNPHQMVRGPPHHLLHPSQHPMQHFNPLQRHPMQLTQPPHMSPNSQSAHMAHRPMHPAMRSPHPSLQIHPSQMQHTQPTMVTDFPNDAKMMKLTKSGVEPKKRGRKSKAELQAIEQAKSLAPEPTPSLGPSLGPSLLQHTAHPSGQEPIIPTTVLAVQNTRLVDPSELGPPGTGPVEVKKRGRRKKFTPLRENLNKPGSEAPVGVEQKTNPILAERLGIQDNRGSLSIATPPQLFSSSSVGQPSVITRLPRPPLGSPFGPGVPPPQRFYSPQPGQPPVSIAQNARLPFSPHGPPPPLTSSPVSASASAPPANHYVQSDHMSRHPPPHPGHFRSPAPAHYSGTPPNYQPASGLPPTVHRSGIQPIETPSSTPQDYSAPSVSVPYAASYGTYYPPHHPATVEHRSQPPSTTPAATQGNSSFEQFDNAKNTPPHDRATPNAYQSPPAEEPAAGSSEFSGLFSTAGSSPRNY